MTEPPTRPEVTGRSSRSKVAVVTEVRLAPPATRHVAAGGWRRAVVGLLVGGIAGALVSRFVAGDTDRDRQARSSR